MSSKSLLLLSLLLLVSISWALPTAASSVLYPTAINTFAAPTPTPQLQTSDLMREIGMGRMNNFDFDEEKEDKIAGPYGTGVRDVRRDAFAHEEEESATSPTEEPKHECSGPPERKLGGKDATIGYHPHPVNGKNTPHRNHHPPSAVPSAAVPSSVGDFIPSASAVAESTPEPLLIPRQLVDILNHGGAESARGRDCRIRGRA